MALSMRLSISLGSPAVTAGARCSARSMPVCIAWSRRGASTPVAAWARCRGAPRGGPRPPRARPWAAGQPLRGSAGSILYLTLIALLSLGIAAIVRDSATSIGVILGLLYLLPILSQVIGNPHWQRLLQQIGPMSAGLAIQATT